MDYGREKMKRSGQVVNLQCLFWGNCYLIIQERWEKLLQKHLQTQQLIDSPLHQLLHNPVSMPLIITNSSVKGKNQQI